MATTNRHGGDFLVLAPIAERIAPIAGVAEPKTKTNRFHRHPVIALSQTVARGQPNLNEKGSRPAQRWYASSEGVWPQMIAATRSENATKNTVNGAG